MFQLPEVFLNRMKKQLGDEYEAFLSCYEQEGFVGLRVNTGKITVEEFLNITPFELVRIPWTENGFYYKKEDAVTRHPHYYAGLYYIQEPSAMLPASRLPVEGGNIVLDLCAAPGGKATELSSRLGGEGLLIANDASASRAKALVKNLSVWGSTNACITGETPEKLYKTFGRVFDRILVDAPCSGEGMFRKDEGLITSWSQRGPEDYAPLQIEILDYAVRMLKPGGYLVYSTCTFASDEDEGVVSEILSRYPQLVLCEIPVCEGFCHGAEPCEQTVRIWPHRVNGEGHYLALLHKKAESAADTEMGLQMYSQKEQIASWKKAAQEILDFTKSITQSVQERFVFQQIKEQCYLLPVWHIPKNLRYLRTGIAFGELKKGRFEPDQALALVFKAGDYRNSISFRSDDPRVIRYLKGETLELSAEEQQDLKKGWVLVCTDGFGLGWGKFTGDSIKNKYYAGWRML